MSSDENKTFTRVLPGTGSNYIATTVRRDCTSQENPLVHINVRMYEEEVIDFQRVASANGYGVILDKQRWEELKDFVDVSFSRLEAKEERKVDIKVNLSCDTKPLREALDKAQLSVVQALLRKDLEEVKEKLAEVLDDVDDVHDSQSAEIRGLDVKVRALEEKVGSFQSGLSGVRGKTNYLELVAVSTNDKLDALASKVSGLANTVSGLVTRESIDDIVATKVKQATVNMVNRYELGDPIHRINRLQDELYVFKKSILEAAKGVQQ